MISSDLPLNPDLFDDADRAAVIRAILAHMPLVCSAADARLVFSVPRFVLKLSDQRSVYLDGSNDPTPVSGARVWMDCASRPDRPPDAIIHWDEIAALASGETMTQTHWF